MAISHQRSSQSKILAFRVDASLNIGSGHVMRCLTLAEVLQDQGIECQFICREHPGHLCGVIQAYGYTVHKLSMEEASPELEPYYSNWLGARWSQDAAACIAILSKLKASWLVVDHYALDHRWETSVLAGLGDSAPLLLVIDDLADRSHVADLLLDQNLGRRRGDYRKLVPSTCRILAGPHYALLRPEFREWRDISVTRRIRKSRIKRILISLGGVDKDNVTGRILEALSTYDLPNDLEIVVVMGAAAPWRELVAEQAKKLPWRINVEFNVHNMAQHMAEADLAIGAAGSTSWERCCVGLPTLIVELAGNQTKIARALVEKDAALPLNLEDLEVSLKTNLVKLADPRLVKTMSARAAAVVDGLGSSRIAAEIKNLDSCRLRPMKEHDLERVLDWRNHWDIRKYMYTQHVITLEEHRAWFTRTNKIPGRYLLIYEQDGEPLGFVKIEIEDNQGGRAKWGFYLAPKAPRGSGQRLGHCTLAHAFTSLELHKLCGEVLADNFRSIRFHERLGLRLEATLRDHFYDGYSYNDVIIFGLLADEWRDLQGATTDESPPD